MSDPTLWDHEAPTFDDAWDHGLRRDDARHAWESLLLPLVGDAPARVADLGCGTGTLSLLLASHGHDVVGVDFSPRMIELARTKQQAEGADATFICADAADPPLTDGDYDVVLSRHVLWAMPDPAEALRVWGALLRPDGIVILVEGRWHTDAGLTAAQTVALLEQCGFRGVTVRHLPEAELWGRDIPDERYVVTARPPLPRAASHPSAA
ncbi:SAM-dependent methyltransferase [Microbacterium phyllosphaerae]|uniref:SAM-dependent methyltransferase n=1 Tax=Microbacterium phyllosphaerae TaxID=124798 RepID=A0ABS4WTW9_9MICO|nr:class I SAM-dependent methyltransferase [Microbacterium phyllosphaerae]MBP2379655.1 SAM-dependent methyltransferase [Microbacterium phyllosphaerae]